MSAKEFKQAPLRGFRARVNRVRTALCSVLRTPPLGWLAQQQNPQLHNPQLQHAQGRAVARDT